MNERSLGNGNNGGVLDQKQNSKNTVTEPPVAILTIDIGGSKVKILAIRTARPAKSSVRQTIDSYSHG
jgi:hypothetical protein